VSTTVTGFAQDAVHAQYPNTTYDTNWLARYFTSIDAAWDPALSLAFCRNGQMPERADPLAFRRVRRSAPDLMADITKHPLIVRRLHLSSPLEITFAAAGSTGVTVYALYLFSAFLRHPEGIGAWLPRLVAGWHRAQREAAIARQEREYVSYLEQATEKEISNLRSISPQLKRFKPVHVSVTGDSEPQEDLADLLEDDAD
jgi:hypothetical protein